MMEKIVCMEVILDSMLVFGMLSKSMSTNSCFATSQLITRKASLANCT